MKKIILASNNKGKIREFNAMLDGLYEVVSMSDRKVEEVPETGSTFVEFVVVTLLLPLLPPPPSKPPTALKGSVTNLKGADTMSLNHPMIYFFLFVNK